MRTTLATPQVLLLVFLVSIILTRPIVHAVVHIPADTIVHDKVVLL